MTTNRDDDPPAPATPPAADPAGPLPAVRSGPMELPLAVPPRRSEAEVPELAWTPVPTEPGGDGPDTAQLHDLVPGTYSLDALRDAVGVGPLEPASGPPVPYAPELDPRDAPKGPPKPKAKQPRRVPSDVDERAGSGGADDLDHAEGSSRGKRMVLWAGAIVVAVTIGTMIIVGKVNSEDYFLSCDSDQIVAERGRSFPPWGTHVLGGDAEWKPIKIPPEAVCHPQSTTDEHVLSGWYLDSLIARATALLTSREVTRVDEAAELLDQALLHARTSDRGDQHKTIVRLQGDVGYWRATARLQAASKSLADAAKQFDDAAAQQPRYVDDSAAWASYVRRIADELKSGPSKKATSVSPTPPERPGAPPGVALPVEPLPQDPPAAPPDAGAPSGGVLL